MGRLAGEARTLQPERPARAVTTSSMAAVPLKRRSDVVPSWQNPTTLLMPLTEKRPPPEISVVWPAGWLAVMNAHGSRLVTPWENSVFTDHAPLGRYTALHHRAVPEGSGMGRVIFVSC